MGAQKTLAMASGFERRLKQTHPERFLAEMAGCTVVAVVRGHEAAIPEGRQWSASGGSGTDASDLLSSALVRPVGSQRESRVGAKEE